MPSICNGASAAPVSSAPVEMDASVTKMVLTYLEKKHRNLEKRKGKLDGYLLKEAAGEKLDKDQKDALKNLPIVAGVIECIKETTEYVTKTVTEEEKRIEKQQRRMAKRQQMENQKQVVGLFVQLFKLQRLLSLVDEAKVQLLDGVKGSLILTEDDFSKLSLFQQLISPLSGDRTSSSDEEAEATFNYLDGKDGSFRGCDFKVFREIVQRIETSGFPNVQAPKDEEPVTEEAVEVEEKAEEVPVQPVAEVIPTAVAEVPHTVQVTQTDDIPSTDETKQIDTTDYETDVPVSVDAEPMAQARIVKEPQEILSAVRGRYNFLQESEIDVPEVDMMGSKNPSDLTSCGFNTFEPFVHLPSGYSIAPSHGVMHDSHQLVVQQPVPYSGHLITLPYPQNLVNDSIYMAHGVPVGYSNGIAMTTPYTMNDAYSQPIASHEISGMMAPTQAAYYNVVEEQQVSDDPVAFGTSADLPAESGEAVVALEAETVEDVHPESESTAVSSEPEKKFSMNLNPNADVFHSKAFPDGEGEMMAPEHAQGGFGGRRNGRGRGRGSYNGYQGRGNGYRGGNGRGGGNYQRYPRNEHRQEGQNGYNGDYNGGWQYVPRRDRGARNGNPRGSGRGGRGGYDRGAPQNIGAEGQE